MRVSHNGWVPLLALVALSCGAPLLAADIEREALRAANARGGLIVHVGCGDGRLAAELATAGARLVHALETDPRNVHAARQRFLRAGYRGRVSADRFDGTHLPYVDNLVNLVVCTRRFALSREEIMRALCPGGVALIAKADGLERLVKPRPDNLDEWTHYLHDADNNAVSRDTAITAPLRHLQWKAGPRYSRHHDKSSSIPAVVAAGGRIFAIVDEGPRASILWPPKWQLVARDAFNGLALWRRPIKQWTSHLWPLKSGPAVTPRRLVAVGDRVYVTLGIFSPVSKLDAATGNTLHTYAGTEKTDEIVLDDGVLYLVINPDISPQPTGAWKRSPRTLMAVRESDGAVLWRQRLAWIAPCTLAIGGSRAFVCDGSSILAFDRATGRQLWRSEPLPQRKRMPTYFAPTLVAAPGAVLYAGGENWHEHAGSLGLMTCLDAETGKIRWQRPHLPSGYQSPQDIFLIGGRAWCGSTNSKPGEFDRRYPDVAPSTGEFVAYDLATGQPAGRIPCGAKCYWFHHRCHRAKATERFFLTSRTGIEMIDIRTGKWFLHHWVRGACLYGIVPANGLVYAPPHPCACYPEAKLTGFNAVAGAGSRSPIEALVRAPRLEKGPAYGSPPPAAETSAEDWPTFRANPARSGSTAAAVGTDLAVAWQTPLGGRLSQPVIAGGSVFVAGIDDHALYALDRQSGKRRWTFVAGGRIDSPPTIFRGMALFGSADGHVYCLRASDGELLWRFRAAPCDRRLVAYEQLESVWPVHGSVLVRDGVAYAVAGRSMFLDGGLTLYRLDPATGKVLSENHMTETDPATGKDLHAFVSVLDMPVASPDILSSEGRFLFMRSQPFDLAGRRIRVRQVPVNQQVGDDAHLFVPNGFLDDQWWHRAFWVYGRAVRGGPGYAETGRRAPCGKIMALDERNLYIFGREPKFWRWTTPLEFRLFCVSRRPGPSQPAPAGRRARTSLPYPTLWSVEVPILVRAMVKAGDVVFVAGPPDIVDEEQWRKLLAQKPQVFARQAELFAGKEGSLLWAISARDGAKIREMKFDFLPVFDGLVAAEGHLYLATADGKVVCLKGR